MRVLRCGLLRLSSAPNLRAYPEGRGFKSAAYPGGRRPMVEPRRVLAIRTPSNDATRESPDAAQPSQASLKKRRGRLIAIACRRHKRYGSAFHASTSRLGHETTTLWASSASRKWLSAAMKSMQPWKQTDAASSRRLIEPRRSRPGASSSCSTIRSRSRWSRLGARSFVNTLITLRPTGVVSVGDLPYSLRAMPHAWPSAPVASGCRAWRKCVRGGSRSCSSDVQPVRDLLRGGSRRGGRGDAFFLRREAVGLEPLTPPPSARDPKLVVCVRGQPRGAAARRAVRKSQTLVSRKRGGACVPSRTSASPAGADDDGPGRWSRDGSCIGGEQRLPMPRLPGAFAYAVVARSPCSNANAVAAAREVTPILVKMLDVCRDTVLMLR